MGCIVIVARYFTMSFSTVLRPPTEVVTLMFTPLKGTLLTRPVVL